MGKDSKIPILRMCSAISCAQGDVLRHVSAPCNRKPTTILKTTALPGPQMSVFGTCF